MGVASFASGLADLVGSCATRRRNVVDNWVRADRVVAVVWKGQRLVPGFQLLADGSPDGVLQPALRVLRSFGAEPWERAIWWTVPAPRLEGRRPVDVLYAARGGVDQERDDVAAQLASAAARRRDWF